jgi:hypothetical protein
MKPPFTWLVEKAQERWKFEPKESGTHIEWVFSTGIESLST